MASIKDEAMNFTPTNTLNISDLAKVSTDLELVKDSFEITDKVTKEQKTVNQEVVIVEDIKYRCPVSVKQQLKVLLEDNPALKFFKVKRTGTTMEDTRYQVIPLME